MPISLILRWGLTIPFGNNLYCKLDSTALYLFIYTALTPGPIQNLKSAVNTHKPSVMLKWDPPANAAYPGSVTKYQIRFLDNERVSYGMKVVNGCTSETVITGVPESSGTLSSLEVTACSGNNESQECRSVSNLHFAGKCMHVRGMYVPNNTAFS